MFKKFLTICMCIVVGLSVFSGCGQKKESENIELTFMGWGTDSEIATFQKMIDAFEEKYTNVKVNYITVADDEFDTKLQAMIGAGTAPDVFYCNIDKMMKYASTGNLYNLTDYVADNDIFDADNVWPCLLDLYKYDGNYFINFVKDMKIKDKLIL